MPLPLYVAFVWHQHQPEYRDPFTGVARLPWTRLHAAKDYVHMAELVAEFPRIHCTFNFVPSLLDQLDTLAQARLQDEWETLSLQESWTRDEKRFILEHFFSIHPRLLERYPPYVRLRDSKSIDASDQYFRDLAAWFNLAWTDSRAIERDPALTALTQKGEGFTRDNVGAIIAKQRELAARVIPFHRELAARGQIELSVTPYFHPILPLLVNQESAREAMSNIQLPASNFRHSEDAVEQLQRAVSAYERHFGAPPHGLWPSEGAVSDALIHLLPQNFHWLATDEAILARSLGISIERDADGHVTNPRMLYQPYRIAARSQVAIIFRDHSLANQLSFKYQHLSAHDAVKDLVSRLHAIRARLEDSEYGYLVPIIMDGENAWEAYEDNGDAFFRALYSLVSNDAHLKTVTVAEYLAEFPPRVELSRLAAGSWINANFDTWIGERAHNRAWELLAHTRRALASARVDADSARRAWDELYAAEGSDWFWWYSPRNNSGQDAIFDELFRAHLRRIHELIGENVPHELSEPIIN